MSEPESDKKKVVIQESALVPQEEKEKSNQIEFNNEDQEALISEKKNYDQDKKL